MIWTVPNTKQISVLLPQSFTIATMYPLVDQVLDEQRDARCSEVTFDFSRLSFIEPVGVVVLSNLIEYFKRMGVRVLFSFVRMNTAATQYLDDAGFFEHYVGEKLSPHSRLRSTTMPLQLIQGSKATEYLYFKLVPWISRNVGQSEHSLQALRASLEEIFHNVYDHSGVDIGCTFSQYFPREHAIQIAISDFGEGIPNVVRRIAPHVEDAEAMRLACQEGFTTKSNVQNRGAGLPTLTRYVTKRNGGTVMIASARAQVAASPDVGGDMKIVAKSARGFYPGTLVRVILRTDTLVQLAEDVEPEDFEW